MKTPIIVADKCMDAYEYEIYFSCGTEYPAYSTPEINFKFHQDLINKLRARLICIVIAELTKVIFCY